MDTVVKQSKDPRGLTLIEGRKKGGAGRTPVEDKDSLRSTQIARIVDAIGEGECEGLANGLKDVFLDGVPIQNADGSMNFEGVTFAWTAGTQGQPAVPSMSGVENEIAVQVDVKKATPIIRTISDPDVDAVRVTIAVPQLTDQDMSTGDLRGSTFEWVIEVQSSGGGFVERYRDTVSGKCTTTYTKSVLVNIAGTAPHDIRVKRITDDSAASNVVNGFAWQSYAEIIQRKLRYPHTCMSYLQVNAQQFARVPQRSWRWRGLRVKVPSNYDPITRAYTGTWDGTFKMAWTNNPAWCMYAMVTNKRWGLGNFVSETFQNKWALYKIGKYCDELVPNGLGGTEPRFTCNWVFSTREQAYKVLQDLAAVFRGMTWWANSTVEYAQDAPQDAQMLYTAANVVDGTFTYQDTSEKTLHSVFICYWNDLSQQAKRIPEVYAPSDLIAKYGVREIQIQLIGCTSRSQAARMCRWMRYSEEMEGTAVSFRVGPDGQIAAPGKVFRVSDPNEAGERLGGRVQQATSSAITLDAPVELKAGQTYTLTCLSFDPVDPMVVATEERTVTTAAVASTQVLQVSPPFTTVPSAGTTWILASAALQATTWRCLSVQPVNGRSNIEYEITGIAHNPSKFGFIENGLTLDEPVISRLQSTVLPPSNLQLVETVYSDGVANQSRLTASWVPSGESLRHSVSYRTDTGWWQTLPDTSAQSIDINPIQPGVYEVAVKSTNVLGNTSPSTQGSITIAGGASGVRAVRLQASALVIKVATNGTASPASVSIAANIGGLAGAITWTVNDGSVLTGTGSTKTLTAAAMASNATTITATVTERGQSYSDSVTVLKVFDGAQGPAGATGAAGQPGATGATGQPGTAGATGAAGAPAVAAQMTLDAIALPADSAGNVISYTGANSSMFITLGGANDTANWAFSHVASSALTVTRTNETVTITAMNAANDIGTIDVTATRSGYASITRRVYVSKAKAGAAGAAGAQGAQGATGAQGPTGAAGASAKLLVLSATSQVFQITKAGANNPSAITLTATGQNLTGAPTFTVTAGTATLTGTGTSRSLTFANMGTDSVTVQVTQDGQADSITIVKLREGSDGAAGAAGQAGATGATGAAGADAITMVISNEAHTVPADQNGVVASFAGATSTTKVYRGITDDTANWTISKADTALTSTLASGAVTVTAMSADTGYVDITATRSGFATIVKRFTVTKSKTGATGATGAQGAAGAQGATGATGAAGQRGSVTRAYTTTVTSWSDSQAVAALTAAGYSGPINLDIVTLVNPTANWSEARFYANGSWLAMQAWITGNLMVDGTVATSKLLVNGGVGSSLWPDPNCVDPSMWDFGAHGNSATFRITASGNTGINVIASGAAPASADGFPLQPVTQGKTYKISALVRTLPNTNGTFYLRYVHSATAKGSRTQVAGNVEGATVPQQWTEYEWEFTPPAGAQYVSPRVILNWGGNAGDMECQNVRIREMLDSSMVVQGGLTADRISTPKLSALSSILGSVEIDASGSLRAGQTAFDTGVGFWQGYSGGVYKSSLKNVSGQGFKFDGAQFLINGALAIEAVNAVDTDNLVANAVTIPVSVLWSGTITLPSNGAWSGDLVTLPAKDFRGQPVVIIAYVVVTGVNGSGASGLLAITRNGARFDEQSFVSTSSFLYNYAGRPPAVQISHMSIDSGQTGAVSYGMQVNTTGGANVNTSGYTVTSVRLLALGVKK